MDDYGVRAGWEIKRAPLSMDATPRASKNAGLAIKYSGGKSALVPRCSDNYSQINPRLVWVGKDLKNHLVPTSLGLSRADTGAALIHEIHKFFPRELPSNLCLWFWKGFGCTRQVLLTRAPRSSSRAAHSSYLEFEVT